MCRCPPDRGSWSETRVRTIATCTAMEFYTMHAQSRQVSRYEFSYLNGHSQHNPACSSCKRVGPSWLERLFFKKKDMTVRSIAKIWMRSQKIKIPRMLLCRGRGPACPGTPRTPARTDAAPSASYMPHASHIRYTRSRMRLQRNS